MFEIRVICAAADIDRVTHELAAAFRTGEPRTTRPATAAPAST